MTDRSDDEPLELDLPVPDLPTLDDGDVDGDSLGLDDPDAVQLAELSQSDDPFDDSVAHDLPIDVEIDTDSVEPSAIGDDANGLHDEDIGQELELDGDDEASFLDDRGRAEEGLEMDGDDELGIDPIPREVDDGGLEGLDDPDEERVETNFPPLDGDEDDDEGAELDLGIEISTPDHPLDG